MSAMNVGNFLPLALPCIIVREFTLFKGFKCIVNVGNHLAINLCPLDIGEFTLCKCLEFRECAIVLFTVMTIK